ncbi:MAG: winged helix-turn-helix transcriptional regulator [Planctomycetes bacterium]|nr:winged helix-turn-helix transcriptional regulator [Planctomycetota bacterium]
MIVQKNNKRGKRQSGECGRTLEELLDPNVFRALGDPTRVRILAALMRQSGPCCVTRAADCCPVDLSVVSRHLSALQDAGIVQAEKRGREVQYTLRTTSLSGLLRELAAAIDECCPPGEKPAPEKAAKPASKRPRRAAARKKGSRKP